MSVVVRMEMPTSCEKCPACDYEEGNCLLADDRNTLPHNGKRRAWCPILCQLPEGHGRLIDADALRQVLEVFTEKDTLGHTPLQLCDAMPAAPRWVRCEDGVPKEAGSYLVYAPSYCGGSSSAKECKAGVMFAKWLKGGHWSIEVGYYKRPGCVTHWMSIEPPKEDA